MIGRVVALLGSVVELGLAGAEDVVSVLSALRHAPTSRRVRLAANILRGRPTAYRIDGVRPLGGQGVMLAECTLAPSGFVPAESWPVCPGSH